MREFVSIIVPVYNVAQYLDRCLTSLTGQTYGNIEILLVDDGSTDTSGALCDAWKNRDDRIRVFHKANGGLSDARNYGLQRATGEYVCFIDSDDWLHQNFIEVMLQVLTETGADIAECDYLCTDGNKPVPDTALTAGQYEVFEGKECFRRFLICHFFVSVCNKLYRTGVLQDQLFRKGAYHEDEFWTYRIFSNARKACRLHSTGYYYFQRHGSITHSEQSRKKITDAFDAGKERVDFIEQRYPEFASIGYSKMMYTCMYLFNEVKHSNITGKDGMMEELKAYFRSIFGKYLKRREYQKEMWRFCFFRVLPELYCRLNY